MNDSDKEDFLKIVINSKRDLTKDNSSNLIGFETNLDPEFLNLFVLDAWVFNYYFKLFEYIYIVKIKYLLIFLVN